MMITQFITLFLCIVNVAHTGCPSYSSGALLGCEIGCVLVTEPPCRQIIPDVQGVDNYNNEV